jgi:hypothetical protein
VVHRRGGKRLLSRLFLAANLATKLIHFIFLSQLAGFAPAAKAVDSQTQVT